MATQLQNYISLIKEEPWEELDNLTINVICVLMAPLQHNNGYFYDQDKRLLLWAYDNGASLQVNRIKNLLVELNASYKDMETLLYICWRINNGTRVRPPKWSYDKFKPEYKIELLTSAEFRAILTNQ